MCGRECYRVLVVCMVSKGPGFIELQICYVDQYVQFGVLRSFIIIMDVYCYMSIF